jgi:LAGLIDADG endonuclease
MDIIESKEYLTKKGFIKVLSIKSVFPKGLSNKVLEFFSKENILFLKKPVFEPSKMPLNPYWITGFVQADGTFGLNYTKQVKMKLGYTFQPQFRITQHERDLIVLNRIIATMGCGVLVKPTGDRDRYNISVANLKDLVNIVIPIFEKYPLYGTKYLDFIDFCKGIQIIKNKGHLTSEGLNQLKYIAYGMNTYRKLKKNFFIL